MIRGDETQKIGILSCVGTSILFHYSQWLKKPVNSSLSFDEVDSYLSSIYQDLLSEHPRYPSAELQTLALYFKENPTLKPTIKHITLFPTETTQGEAAAFLLCKIFTDQNLGSILFQGPAHVLVKPFPLDLDEERSSYQITELVTRFREEAAYYRKLSFDRIVISISAGYKVVTPYLSLLAFLDGEEVIYNHQHSKGITTLPQLPFHWDLRQLDEFRTWLVMDEIPSSVYYSLPKRYRSFYGSKPEMKDSGTVFIKSPFGKMISKDYSGGRHLRYGWGETLLQGIRDQSLRDELTTIIQNKWEYLFLGDQIPETVEHTRGHSQRLMELGRDLLHLISLKLKDETLFILISALWLHDIGHKALNSKSLGERRFPLYLYPSLVRRYHHVLSAELIDSLDDFNPSICSTIAKLALYHRRSMPLFSHQGGYKDDLFQLSFEPLEEVLGDLDFRGTIVSKKELLFLAALLRFLDSCDVQADRVINPYYQQARTKRTQQEILVYIGRLKYLMTRLIEKNALDQEVLSIITKVHHLSPYQGTSNEVKKWEKEITYLALHLFNTGRDGHELELLGIADSILFKLAQKYHLEKHAGIECVYLGAGSSLKKPLKINIYLLSRICFREKRESVIKRIDAVGSSILEEYRAVQDILQDYFVLQDVNWNMGDKIIQLFSL